MINNNPLINLYGKDFILKYVNNKDIDSTVSYVLSLLVPYKTEDDIFKFTSIAVKDIIKFNYNNSASKYQQFVLMKGKLNSLIFKKDTKWMTIPL